MLDERQLQSGDLVFIRIRNRLYRLFEPNPRKRTAHVGFIYGRSHSGWLVAESTVPRSCLTPLPEFLARSPGGHFSVKRLKRGMLESEMAALRAAADQRMGIPYDRSFDYASPYQFCSKFVFDCYREACGIAIGEFQTFRELMDFRGDKPVWLWAMGFRGKIPWERQTVTPGTQFESGELFCVAEKLSTAALAEFSR